MDTPEQLHALTLTRECIHQASTSLRLARQTAILAGTTLYTLQLIDQLIDNTMRMENHMRWH